MTRFCPGCASAWRDSGAVAGYYPEAERATAGIHTRFGLLSATHRLGHGGTRTPRARRAAGLRYGPCRFDRSGHRQAHQAAAAKGNMLSVRKSAYLVHMAPDQPDNMEPAADDRRVGKPLPGKPRYAGFMPVQTAHTLPLPCREQEKSCHRAQSFLQVAKCCHKAVPPGKTVAVNARNTRTDARVRSCPHDHLMAIAFLKGRNRP